MKVEIPKKDQTYTFEAGEGEKLLYAGLRAGIPLPYECATGTCATCRARVKEGELDTGWPEAPGKKTLKDERGDFLLCQATGDSDCQIAVPAAIRPFRDDDIVPSYYDGTCENWEQLTRDVLQFDVVLDTSVNFHAGQFFVLEVDGVEGYRAYSMVNYAPSTDTLTFIIKNKPDGGFSNWAFDKERSSNTVKLFGPLGRATFHPDEQQDLFMVAGGSGIAGLMAILEHGSESEYFTQRRVRVFFGVRAIEDAFFVEELNAIQKCFPDNIEVNLIFSDLQQMPADAPDFGSIKTGFGFVHESALESITQDNENTMAYLAGPPPMVDALIRPLIIDVRMPVTRIRYDKFG